MNIGTAYFFDSRSRQMGNLSAQTAKLQEQISTGKRILTPSDDPIISARIARIQKGDADNTQFASNITLAQSLLGASDTALSSVSDQLQRAQELMIRAGSETLNDDNRAAISAELKAILDDVYSLANTKDARGQALFGGSGTGAAFARAGDGTISFSGTGEAPPIPIGDGVNIQPTDSGARVFGGVKVGNGTKDIFQVIGDLADALAPGGSADAAARKQALSQAAEGLANASERITTARASVGARGARLDIESDRLAGAANDYKIERGSLEGTDIQSAVIEMQKMMLTLQATQSSFSRLSSLTLFDYIR
jgi:flagellar hook-associated protein 3 FlgL